MNLWVKILMLLSLCFNLGAGVLEDCASDGDAERTYHFVQASDDFDIQVARIHSKPAHEPTPDICHHEVCHFGHCAHVLLIQNLFVEPFELLTHDPRLTGYDHLPSYDFLPNHDRPPVLA